VRRFKVPVSMVTSVTATTTIVLPPPLEEDT